MGKHDDKKRGETTPTRRDDDEERKVNSARRARQTRSPASTTPPKKKHRPGEQPSAKEGEPRSVKKGGRVGIPKETERSELEFPDRYSPPERDSDEHGFYRFRYGENLSPRYKIISKLGEGTFGIVLECWDRIARAYVAIKIIRNIEKYRAAAMIELEALNTLKTNDPEAKHHCIVLDKWFDYRSHVCMVFNKLGPSLFDFLKKNNYNPFDVDVVRDIGYQLLKAVAFMHDHQMIHTDLKPENILFCKDGSGLRVPLDSQIRVIDFGSATFENGHHGRIVSTRHYRAPEIVIGAKWSYACDLWSVGCILVELVTGEALFQTHEDIEHLAMMERVLGRLPKSLAEQRDIHARHLFRDDYRLNWPDGASSRKSIRAVRRLLELKQWIEDVGSKSVKPFLDDFVDLVAELMRFEPEARLPAKDALNHKFFSPYTNGTY